jgi:hypothetical protein
LKCAQSDALRQLTYITNLEQQIDDFKQTNDDLTEELDMLYTLKVNSPQRTELVGQDFSVEHDESGAEYSVLKSALLGLILKYNEKKTLKFRFAFDRWYDFAAEDNGVDAYQRMPTIMREALDSSRPFYQEPIGPRPKTGIFNVMGDRDGLIEASSDDDKFEMSFPNEFGSRTNMKLIGQCTDLVQTVLKQCAVRMVRRYPDLQRREDRS